MRRLPPAAGEGASPPDPLNAQSLFDSVVHRMGLQGAPSADSNGHCLYRGPGVLRCAVGAALRDAEYRPEMEDLKVHSLARLGLLPARLLPFQALLGGLQYAHDGWAEEGLGWFVRHLEALAAAHKLSPDAIYSAFPAHAQARAA